MGLFTKLKDILFEEEVEETAVIEKQEIKEIKEVAPKKREMSLPNKARKEEAKVEDLIDDKIKNRDVFKADPTFPFPLAFEEDVKEVKTRSNKNKLYETNVRKKEQNSYSLLDVPVEKETEPFRPSPVISPVYGILDKNYKKNDVVSKPKKVVSSVKPDFESIRKKAYGTLEDDIENTLNKPLDPIIEEEPINKSIDELLLDTLNIDMTNEMNLPKTIDESEEIIEETIEETDEFSPVEEDTLENDLFDLIDSMYEKRKDGEQ